MDTIAAIATPAGRGGIGIIRISGPLAYQTALSLSGKKSFIPGRIQFVSFKNSHEELIDQGLVLYFKAPHSFTGEDVIEFQVHGSPVLMDCLMSLILMKEVRLAKPGEFSERAYLNNKMDLSQAEAVADLINASSIAAAKMAAKTLQGEFSKHIHSIGEDIVQLRMYVEAALDFPEEDIDFLADGRIASRLEHIIGRITELKNSAAQGVLMREGLSVVIAGAPNAGKSTLINHLARKDIAIVTDIPGTTRDIMREHILLDGMPLHIIDTAGLRESEDIVEQEGIRRALKAVGEADCVLLMSDILTAREQTQELDAIVQQTLSENIPVIRILNKLDKFPQSERRPDCIYISAKTGEGIEDLKRAILQMAGFRPAEGEFLARRRHLQALENALDYLKQGQHQLLNFHAGELLAEYLRLSHQSLCLITGEFTSDELLGKIFSSFCIGK